MAARVPFPTLSLILLVACSSPSDTGIDETALASLSTPSELAEALRGRGASVTATGDVVPSIFTVPAEVLVVDGVPITVHRFPTPEAAEADVPRLEQTLALWAHPMRLYRKDVLLVLARGDVDTLSRLLRDVLGPPVARIGG